MRARPFVFAFAAPVAAHAVPAMAADAAGAPPATLEVCDLQGRRLARQVPSLTAPGPVRVQAGSGQRFAPGAYWLRLTQAGLPPGRRLVIVAR